MSRTDLNVLVVNSSGRKNGSVTRTLANEFIDSLSSDNPNVNVVHRNLNDGMPFVDETWIAANFTPPEDRTAHQAATLSYSDGLVDELKEADIIIIASPIYNFGIPAVLKAWVDQIARARLTFKYTENGPVGLLKDKRAILIAASGGTQAGSEIDFATGYLRHILGFIGVDDVSIIAADRMMMDADGALENARNGMRIAVAGVASACEAKAA